MLGLATRMGGSAWGNEIGGDVVKKSGRNRARGNGCQENHQVLRLLRFGSRLMHADHVLTKPEMEELAEENNVPATIDLRYKSVRLAKMFEDKNRRGHSSELENLLSLPSENGSRIGWSHIIELMQVKRHRERLRFAKRVVGEGLRADALRQLIREHQDHRGSRRPRSGRPRREPFSAWHAVDTAQKDLATLIQTIRWLAASDAWPKSGKKRDSLIEIQTQLATLEGKLKALQSPA